MNIYSDTLLWSDITPIFDPVTDLDLITEIDFIHNFFNVCPFDYTTVAGSGKVEHPEIG